MKCSVTYCHNEQQESGASDEKAITFHSFPKIAQYRDEWVEALGIPFWAPSKHSIVCSEHFKKDDFCLTRGGLKKLKNGVVPTILHTKQDDMDQSASFKVCRICLASKCKMYHIGEHSLDQIYEQISGCSVSTTDKLPQSVCWECAHRLRAAGRLRRLAQGTEVMLLDVLQTAHYISLQDIKSILNTNKNIKSNLVIKHKYENNFDYEIKDDQILVKTEETIDNDDEDYKEDNNKELTVNGEIINDNSAVFTEVPIKDESNDIYLDEFNDFDDSDDNVKLSEVYKPKTKVKRKKIKLVKKVKEQAPKVNKKEKEKEKEEDATPTSTVDKYKTSGVKRRKNLDLIDENLFTITAMTYEEQIAEINKRQENHNYKSAPFKCDICFRGFMVKGRYDVHAIRHSEACGAYECFICKTRMKSARSLRKHLTGQHTEKFSCNGCSFITRNRGVAREHQKWHSGTKYQCPHCPAEFDKLTTYMGHIRIKHVSDFICELCGFTFVSKRGIEVHKYRKHRTTDSEVLLEGPYCETCDVKFISEEAHDRHLKLSSRHSTDNDPNRLRNDSQSVYCDNKGRAVTERRTNIHPRERGESDCGQPVTCEQCGAVLRDLRLYAQHFRRAHPDKNRTKYPAMKTPAMCELCGRIFQSMALLKDHMWVHTGEKRFKCDRCDKSFTQKTNLVFHMRVHSAHRPSYECPLCGKHFAFYNNRRRHMFIHTGLKPFKCDTCGKSFTTSGEQRAHVEHVHLKKPWPKRARHRPGDEWKCTSED